MAIPTAARQFWITAPGTGVIQTTPLPPIGNDQVAVRTLYSGISRGSETIVFRGEVPPSQYEAMRAPFQEGCFPAPVKYGYASVGIVEDTPAAKRSGLVGRPVFCLHPHQDVYVVPASAVTPLPEEVPAARGVLAANLETAVNAVWDARPSAGDRIVVIGAGVVGTLVAWLCRQIPGTSVALVDLKPSRKAVADALGLTFRTDAPADGTADLVFNASGHPSGLVAALSAAGLEATIIEMSWFGTNTVPLPLGEAFHSRRLVIRSSQVGRIPSDRAARWDRQSRMRLAINLLKHQELDALITGESSFEELPHVMARLSSDPGDTLCHRIRY